MPSQSRFVGWLTLALYAGISLGVTNLYPFSTFPMYSDSRFTSGARLVAIGPDGRAREVRRYEAWSCADSAPIVTVQCPDGRRVQPVTYLTKEATDYIGAHGVQGDERGRRVSVALVVREWRLSSERDDVQVADCHVRTCEARLR